MQNDYQENYFQIFCRKYVLTDVLDPSPNQVTQRLQTTDLFFFGLVNKVNITLSKGKRMRASEHNLFKKHKYPGKKKNTSETAK